MLKYPIVVSCNILSEIRGATQSNLEIRNLYPSDGQVRDEGQVNKSSETNSIHSGNSEQKDARDTPEFFSKEDRNDEDYLLGVELGAWVHCTLCRRNFKSKKQLKRHLTTHPKPYACKVCNKT